MERPPHVIPAFKYPFPGAVALAPLAAVAQHLVLLLANDLKRHPPEPKLPEIARAPIMCNTQLARFF